MKKKILGLDIRSDAVSLVLLMCSHKKTEIETHADIPISNPADFENGLAAALATITEKIDITGAVCVASFPAERISYRNIQVPFKQQKKIRQMLPYELEPALPFAVDDLIIDFQTIALLEQSDHSGLIVAAVAKTDLQAYLDTLASHNIEPEIVTVGGYPAALCLARNTDSPENFMFVDIDNHKCSVFAVLSREVCLIRSFPIHSGNSALAAESLSINIRRTWSAFEEIFGIDFQPESLFVTGYRPDDPEFEQNMAKTLGISVKQTDLASAVKIEGRPHPGYSSSRMDNAFALALMGAKGINGLNFRRGPFAAKKFWVEHKKSLLKTGVLAGLVILLAFFNVALDSYFMEKKLARLNRQITEIFISTFPNIKTVIDPYQQMQAEIRALKKNAIIPEGSGPHIRSIDILNNISRLIPKETDVNLTKLVIGPESVMISGDTDTFNAVDDIKSRLEKAEILKKITINSANIDRTDNRVRFNLKVQL